MYTDEHGRPPAPQPHLTSAVEVMESRCHKKTRNLRVLLGLHFERAGEKTIVLLLGFIFLIHLLPHGRTGEIEQKRSSFLIFVQKPAVFVMLAKI